MTEKQPKPTMEKPQTTLGKKDHAPSSGTPPALFVLLQQPQGNDKSEQEVLLPDQDAGSSSSDVPAIAPIPFNPKSKTCLAADCKVAGIKVVLDNNTMWNEFYRRSTEMILTKQGRRMFPYCRYWITGLDPNLKYILVMDIAPVDNQRYKWNGRWWEPSGKAEPHVLGRVFIHPESPSTGQYWMHQPVSFYKLKLTNNYLDQEGHIILHSMHRYLPRLHLVPADRATEVIQLNGPDVHTFTFPQTEFFAVTAYQNIQITQLKIDYNPFAKGFREDALVTKPFKDILAKVRSDLESAGDSTSPSTCGQVENLGTDSLRKDQCSLAGSHDQLHSDIEKDSFNAERDFLNFLNPDVAVGDVNRTMRENLDSTQPSSVGNFSHAASPIDVSEPDDAVIKEEPVDDYNYEKNEKTVGTDAGVVKQEDSEEEDTDEYSNSEEDYPILERQLMKQSALDRISDNRPFKRTLKSQSGVARAKMLKLESGKLPVIDVETCANKIGVLQAAELEDNIVLSGKQDESLNKEMDLSTSVEESLISSMNFSESKGTKNIVFENKKKSKCSLPTKPVENISESSRSFDKPETHTLFPKDSEDDPILSKITKKRKSTPTLKYQESLDYAVEELTPPVSPVRRGRPRKTKFSKVGRQPKKSVGKFVEQSQKAIPPRNDAFSNANLDLEDVDGVLFVSFVSKEALDIHTVDKPVVGKGLQSVLTSSSFEKTGDARKIDHLEKQLLEDLKSLRHKQVIHPALQEVGLKLGVVDPTMSIDLRYLGVQLPLPYFSISGLCDDSVPDPAQPFISRTGKTSDITKIKGWRDKFSTNTSSTSEGGISVGPMKNRSAFCSDKLDEYLENEAKLMESDLDPPPDVAPPINYQLPTKSTSYVRTLDSVLKKQSTSFPSSTLKTLSSPPARKKVQACSKPTPSSTKVKRAYRRILPSTGRVKEKFNSRRLLTKTPTSHSINSSANMIHRFLLPALDENMLPKQINLALAQQQQQNSARFPGVSKSYLKLIDLEECAVWDGEPRTYITEERADISLATLLTAQVSLKSKPVRRIIQRRAPACNNEFCRLGCVCASLSQEKRQPTHCRRPECMFGCTCLKRKMMLVRGGPKDKTIIKKEDDDNLLSESFVKGPQLSLKEEDPESEEDENSIYGSHQLKKVKLEYTICDTEPEEPVRRSFSIWEKGESDEDPEPIFIPKPSVNEPTHSGTLEYTSSTRSKPGRIYTPKPNPVVRDEDKDPVYLYFENMMTCARVRAYERKTKQHVKQEMSDQCTCGSSQCIAKHYPEHQQKGAVCKMEKANRNPTDKSWRLAHSKTNTSTSHVHKITSGGPTKLIEIISDCNWEEDRDTILNILSQQINSNMPRSLKVGNFIVELASESKTRDEKHPPFVSSRVKISMPSCQDKYEDDEMSDLETSDIGSFSSSCRKAEITEFPQDESSNTLPERSPGCKGLPFYTGLSQAGRLIANKHAPDSNASGLIQVNGKSYPQAKLLLGQMGALHPANRLAAYITGRLRPTVLDLSTLSTVISKVSSSSKTSTPVTTATTSVTKPTATLSSSSNTASDAATLTFTAARPSPGGVFTQFMVNKAGSLQQKIPVIGTPQPVSVSQKFNVSPTSYVVVTPVANSRSCQVFTTTPTTQISTLPTPPAALSVPVFTAATLLSKVNANEVVSPTTTPPKNPAITLVSPSKIQSSAGFGVTLASQTRSTTSPATVSSATVTTTKATVKFPTTPVTPLTPLSFARTIVSTSAIPFPVTTTTSASLVATTKATSFVSTPAPSTSGSTIGSVPILLSGLHSLSQKPGTGSQASVAVSSTPLLSPGTEKHIGPRLLLIPVPSGSPAVRPARNVQLAQGQRMVLQPFRNPGGVNLFRHPNGQIIQLVPLQQLRAAGSQPKVQPLLLRNPGTVMGIQLPLPKKVPDACKQLPMSTSSFVLSSPVVGTKVANVVSSSTNNAISHATTSLSSVPSFVSQAGTLTLRISPPISSSQAPGQTSVNSKIITYSSAGQPMGSASLVPLQSGSFALLQLPGQKPVPSSILNHAASLQLLKDTQTASEKEQQDLNGEPDSKTSSSDEEATTIREKTLLETECDSSEKQVVCNDTNLANNLQTGLSAASVQIMRDNSQSGTLGDTTDQESKLLKGIVEPIDPREQESPNPKEIHKEKKVDLDSCNKEQMEHAGFSEHAEEPIGLSADCSMVVSRNCADGGDPVEPVGNGEQTSIEFNNGEESRASAQSLSCTNNEATNLIDKPNETMYSDGKGDTVETHVLAGEFFSQLGDHDNHVNPAQTSCQDQLENKPGPNLNNVEIESNATGTSYVAETKTNIGLTQGFNNYLEENRGSKKDVAASKDLKSSSLVSESISNEKKEMSINHEDFGDSSSQPFVPDIKTEESSPLKKTLVLINIDKEEHEEEDDKSDDSADDLMEDASSDEEEVNVDANEFMKDDEEHVDIETVEELSEKFNIARLKAKAAHFGPSKQQCMFHNPLADTDKKLSHWKKKQSSEANPFKYYRETHTANERRRRLEMRTLFENLQKILGLNLPKVSKSFILTQAYEEIQGLTDQADKLIGRKNLLTRKQDILIRKVSALSGKTEEVVLKKLEYIYAKQKALDAQRKKRQKGEEELAQQLRPSRLLKQELSLESLRHVEPSTLANHKRLKPLILATKPQQVEEPATSAINLSGARLMMTPQGQVISLKNSLMPSPSTVFQDDLSTQVKCNALTAQQGITSMLIQLPGSSVPVQLKGILTSSSLPIALSTTTNSTIASTMSEAAQLRTEIDDLFMMPKIVNVTSLANEPGLGLKLRIAKTPASASIVAKASDKTLRHEATVGENTLGKLAPVPLRGVVQHCEKGSSSNVTQLAQFAITDRDLISKQVLNFKSTNKASVNRLHEIKSLAVLHGEKKENKVESEQLAMKDSPFLKVLSKDVKDLIDVELKHGASSVEEVALNTSELISGIEEHDDPDETLTSLLNEIAFLNQQLNNDTPSISVSPNLSLGDSVMGGKDIVAGDLSSVQFSSFRELFDEKETKGDVSPLLLQLEQSDFQTGEKQSGEPSSGDTLNVVGCQKDDTSQLSIKDHSVSSHFVADTASSSPPPILQKKTKQELGSTDTLWRPMPKLAPLGLKVTQLPTDQEGQANKVMPALAPVTTKIGPLWAKAAVPTTKQEQVKKTMPVLSSVAAKENNDSALPSATSDK